VSFNLPAVARKKVRAAFDGGQITTDGGVTLRPRPALLWRPTVLPKVEQQRQGV